MQKYYKRQNGNFILVLKVISREGNKVNCVQYLNNGACPIEYLTSSIELDEVNDYWKPVSEGEAEKSIGNMKEQEELLSHRLSEENVKWAKELTSVLSEIDAFDVMYITGTVRITSYENDFSKSWEISRSPEGKIQCKKLT